MAPLTTDTSLAETIWTPAPKPSAGPVGSRDCGSMRILTFDIEEWYLYQLREHGGRDFYLPVLDGYLGELLNLLESRGFKATFFCLGAIAREFPGVIRRIADRGHEIGCHSDKHRWLTEFGPKEFRGDTKAALDALESAIGAKVKSYRAPAFSIGEKNRWAFEVLAEHGIERDSSIFPASRDFGGFPTFGEKRPVNVSYGGVTLKEFPIGTVRVFGKELAYSGGGYFRLLPYGITRRIIASQDYAMVYLHVRDFDKMQKRALTLRYFKDYYGIRGAWAKFCRLLADFDFVNVERADGMTDWGARPVVQL
jgi:polysaccharide deacetylase family protein (PEP-CTERM system associated)